MRADGLERRRRRFQILKEMSYSALADEVLASHPFAKTKAKGWGTEHCSFGQDYFFA
jgi:hypothetical protein